MSGQYVYANPSIGIQAFRDPRQAYAQALMVNGSSTAPVHSWGEALARALQAPLGGYMQAKTFQGYQQQDEAYRTKLAAALKSPDPISAIQTSDDPTLQNMGLEYGIKLAEDKSQAKLKMINDLAAKGIKYDEATGQLSKMPLYGEVLGQIASEETTAKIPGDVAHASALLPVAAQGAAMNAQAVLPTQKELSQYNTNLDIASAGQKAAAVAAATEPYKDPSLITLISPTGEAATYNKKDPQVATLISKGYTERSGADPNSKKYTEDQYKAAQQYLVASREMPILKQNWSALKNTMAQVATMGPDAVKNWLSSPEYQRALNAAAVIMQASLRTESGATITFDEAKQKAAVLMPQIGESDASMADKQTRFDNMLDGVKFRAGGAAAEVDQINEKRTKELLQQYGLPGQ